MGKTFGRPAPQVIWVIADGSNSSSAATSVAFYFGRAFLSSTTNPGFVFPRAAQLIGLASDADCNADTIPGDWLLRVRKNQSVTSEISYNIPITVAGSKQSIRTGTIGAGNLIFQPADSLWLFAISNGNTKDNVKISLTLEFLLI